MNVMYTSFILPLYLQKGLPCELHVRPTRPVLIFITTHSYAPHVPSVYVIADAMATFEITLVLTCSRMDTIVDGSYTCHDEILEQIHVILLLQPLPLLDNVVNILMMSHHVLQYHMVQYHEKRKYLVQC